MNAADWLRGHLEASGGRAQARDVLQAAVDAGYTRDQVKRAKAKAGVVSRHPAIGGPWYWHLAKPSETAQEPRCRGCSRSRDLTDGYCATCAMALSRGGHRPMTTRPRPKSWSAWA